MARQSYLRSVVRGFSATFIIGAAIGCSVIATAELKTGIGGKCTADGDCQDGLCEKGLCTAQCTTDEACPKPSICVANKCKLGCKADTECAAGQVCDANACRAGCRSNDECKTSGQICDPTGRTCRAGCLDNTGCTVGNVCDKGTLTCVMGCTEDKGCPSGNICVSGGCKAGCRVGDATKGCAAGQYCDADTTCKAAVQVAALVPGGADFTDGWSTSHKIGLDSAASTRPFVFFKDKPYTLVQKASTSKLTSDAIDAQVAAGAQMIITTSNVEHEQAFAAAAKYTSTKFALINAKDNKGIANVAAYTTNTDAGWYVAGRVAGRVVAPTSKKCVGLILPNAGHEIIRDANAFILGVKKQAPTAKVVIRWLGAPLDPNAASYTFTSTSGYYNATASTPLNREELLAAQIADLGCGVIAHHTATQRTVGFVQNKLKTPFKSIFATDLFAVGADIETACLSDISNPSSDWQTNCLGTLHWNWAPKYGQIFDLLKAGTWTSGVSTEPWRATGDAIMKFKVSAVSSVLSGIPETDVDGYAKQVADAPDTAFDPSNYGSGIVFTGQRDLDKDNKPDAKQTAFASEAPLDDVNELDRMCWFVDGAYEFPACAGTTFVEGTPNAGCSTTYDKLVPALVPYGPAMDATSTTCTSRADDCTSTTSPANAADRAKYGDLIEFIRGGKIAGDPAATMDCRLN